MRTIAEQTLYTCGPCGCGANEFNFRCGFALCRAKKYLRLPALEVDQSRHFSKWLHRNNWSQTDSFCGLWYRNALVRQCQHSAAPPRNSCTDSGRGFQYAVLCESGPDSPRCSGCENSKGLKFRKISASEKLQWIVLTSEGHRMKRCRLHCKTKIDPVHDHAIVETQDHFVALKSRKHFDVNIH